jgi:ureidoglycolate hydrolase
MEATLLEAHNYHGEGYKPLIDYGEWRVAILRFLDGLQPDRIDAMERHTETDEVFVLLRGKGVLIIGGNGGQVDKIRPQVMEPGEIYNVKRNAWHTILLSRDASVLLIENNNTGDPNTEHTSLSAEHRSSIRKAAQREQVI